MLTVADLMRHAQDGTILSHAEVGAQFVILSVRTEPADGDWPVYGDLIPICWATVRWYLQGDESDTRFYADDDLVQHGIAQVA